MSVNALSGHGTKIDVQLEPGGEWVEVAELRDITPPGLSRNEFDATTQNEDIDSYVLGVLRRETVTVQMNFIPSAETHDHLTGMQYLLINNVMTGWRFRFPDVPPTVWVASGQCSGFKPEAPVDGLMSAECTIRFSGGMLIGDVEVGTGLPAAQMAGETLHSRADGKVPVYNQGPSAGGTAPDRR